MTAVPTTAQSGVPVARAPMLTTLRFLLLAEAIAGLALAVVLSLLAGDAADRGAETSLRFAAGGAFLFAIFGAVASRGVRRRRGWAWTLSAILQVLLAIGTGVAVMSAEWHPAYLAGFAAATLVMIVLSAGSVRRALGQA